MVICSRMSGGPNGCPDNVVGTPQAAGLNHTPGTLFALPLIDFPAGFIKAFIDWELPKGRHQDDHYLHPAIPLVSRLPSPFDSDCSLSLGVFRLHAGSTEMATLAVGPLAGLALRFWVYITAVILCTITDDLLPAEYISACCTDGVPDQGNVLMVAGHCNGN